MRGNTRNHGYLKHTDEARPKRTYSVVDKITNSADAIKTISISTYPRISQLVPALNDWVYTSFDCDGTETTLDITTLKDTDQAKWDLYVNGVVDSTGYDDYNGSVANNQRHITLTQPIRQGKNTIGLKAASKNAASSNYRISVVGMVLQ